MSRFIRLHNVVPCQPRCRAAQPSGTIRAFRFCALMMVAVCILSKPLALVSICAYQRFISPHKGWRCAYAVLHNGRSCSEYGKSAIARHGVVSGLWLLRNRFDDCNKAANILAASSANQAGNECASACERSEKDCANDCVRGCAGGHSYTPSSPNNANTPTKFIDPCTDAGHYRQFGWFDPEHPDQPHLGHDYEAVAGTEVRAIADGIVIDVDLHVGGFGGSNPAKSGPLMWIRHRTSTGEYFHALYGHMKPCKSKGQWVTAGEVVGTVIPFYDGEDLISHLHFGIWQGKTSLPAGHLGYGSKRNFVDPIEFMNTHQPGAFRR